MAIGDLTITFSRESVVDFTMPFMSTGIGMLYRKPERKTQLFFFLCPMTIDVWLCMLAAYLATGTMLHLVARISPLERRILEVPEKCWKDESATKVKNSFGIVNSLWYTASAFLYQSCDTCPRATSTRIVAIAWWVFSLVMVSFYTANMAAFLVNEKLTFSLQSFHDLTEQSHIEYGCTASGSTEAFFKESKLEPFQRMWAVMSASRNELLTRTNLDGVERVLQGNYAFLMESSTIEYLARRDCRLAQVGDLLDSKGYGVALSTGT